MTDPISDFIIRIKNAVLARKDVITVPHSRVKEAIAGILQKEGYIAEVTSQEEAGFKQLVITLKYVGKNPTVTDVRRLSKPGRRLYVPASDIPKSLGGYGITILSTNKGIITDTDARKMNVGGELLCQIW